MGPPPRTLDDYIEELRGGLICDRCGRYVGSLAARRYRRPPYPVAVEPGAPGDVEALIAFEWYMLHRLRQGNFVIRHPEREGKCVSFRAWLAGDGEGGEDRADD